MEAKAVGWGFLGARIGATGGLLAIVLGSSARGHRCELAEFTREAVVVAAVADSGGGGGGGGGREDLREKSEWRKPVGSP